MKSLKTIIYERLHINKDTGVQSYNYYPKTRGELDELVDKLIKERGCNADLNDIDTSEITDMTELFSLSDFNGDISKWNVSNVENMKHLFFNTKLFNGDISNWDVSKVKDMDGMFANSNFNGNIENWNIAKVKNTYHIFYQSPLENNPPKWYKE